MPHPGAPLGLGREDGGGDHDAAARADGARRRFVRQAVAPFEGRVAAHGAGGAGLSLQGVDEFAQHVGERRGRVHAGVVAPGDPTAAPGAAVPVVDAAGAAQAVVLLPAPAAREALFGPTPGPLSTLLATDKLLTVGYVQDIRSIVHRIHDLTGELPKLEPRRTRKAVAKRKRKG